MKKLNLSAIILCGGKATRMGSMCNELPKYMLTIEDKPILTWLIEWLQSKGISEIILALGVLSDYVENHYSRVPDDLIINIEKEGLGTGGAIKNSLGCVSNDHVITLNGDTLFRCDLTSAFNKHLITRSDITQLLSDESNQNSGAVGVDSEGFVTAEFTSDTVKRSATGAYISRKHFLEQLIPEGKISFEEDVIPDLVRKAQMYSYTDTSRPVYDLGTPERYKTGSLLDLRDFFYR